MNGKIEISEGKSRCVSDGSGALYKKSFFRLFVKERERTARPEGTRPNKNKKNLDIIYYDYPLLIPSRF